MMFNSCEFNNLKNKIFTDFSAVRDISLTSSGIKDESVLEVTLRGATSYDEARFIEKNLTDQNLGVKVSVFQGLGNGGG